MVYLRPKVLVLENILRWSGLVGTPTTGRAEDERRLALELAAGVREVVTAAHRDFLPLNRRFARACTRWQVRPTRLDPMARNDHDDWAWDEGVLRSLTALAADITVLGERLSAALQRLDGYAATLGSPRGSDG